VYLKTLQAALVGRYLFSQISSMVSWSI